MATVNLLKVKEKFNFPFKIDVTSSELKIQAFLARKKPDILPQFGLKISNFELE